MQNISTINLTTIPYDLGTSCIETGSNSLTVNVLLPVNLINASLEFTLVDGSVVNTSTLTPTNNWVQYVVPTNYYGTVGTLRVRVKSIGFTSEYVDYVIAETFPANTDIFIELGVSSFNIKKVIKSGGGGGGTSDYTQLSNKPALNSSVMASLTPETSETINGTIQLHRVSKTGSYNDLNDKPSIPSGQIQSDWEQSNTSAVDFIKRKPTIPSKTSQLENDSNFESTLNKVTSISASSTNTQYPTAKLLYDQLLNYLRSLTFVFQNGTGTLRLSNGFFIQMGRTTIIPTPGVVTSTTINFITPFTSEAPLVFTEPITSVPGLQVLGTGYGNVTTTKTDIFLLRTNSVATIIAFYAVGKK